MPHEELMQRAADGAITAEEEQELAGLMAQSDVARSEYESLLHLVRELDAVPLVAAPPVRDAVLAQLRSQAVLRIAPVVGAASGWRRRRVFALAWAAAAVVVIGLAIERLPMVAPVPEEHAAGTMTGAGFSAWPSVARFASGGSTLVVRRSGDRIAFQPRILSDAPIEVQWDPSQLTFSEAEGAADLHDIERGTVRFPDASRTVVVVLKPKKPGGTAIVQVTSAGREMFRWTVASP